MTLGAMVSALDALVEELTPSVRQAVTDIRARRIVDRSREDRPDLAASVAEAEVDAVAQALADHLARTLPKLQIKQRGSGASRWEEVLTQVGLGASAGQAVPNDLDHALGEVIQLRHVIAHRASRIDSSALRQAPSLPYEVDQLVRISRNDYRRLGCVVELRRRGPTPADEGSRTAADAARSVARQRIAQRLTLALRRVHASGMTQNRSLLARPA